MYYVNYVQYFTFIEWAKDQRKREAKCCANTDTFMFNNYVAISTYLCCPTISINGIPVSIMLYTLLYLLAFIGPYFSHIFFLFLVYVFLFTTLTRVYELKQNWEEKVGFMLQTALFSFEFIWSIFMLFLFNVFYTYTYVDRVGYVFG